MKPIRLVPFAVALAAWWAVTSPWGGLPRYVLPSPGAVLTNAVELYGKGTPRCLTLSARAAVTTAGT